MVAGSRCFNILDWRQMQTSQIGQQIVGPFGDVRVDAPAVWRYSNIWILLGRTWTDKYYIYISDNLLRFY